MEVNGLLVLFFYYFVGFFFGILFGVECVKYVVGSDLFGRGRVVVLVFLLV